MLTVFELVNPLTPALSVEAPLEKAVFLFEKFPWSALPVVREGRFCGVLERRELDKLPGYTHARVRDLLRIDTVFLSPDDAAEDAADLLASGFLDVIPVVSGGGCLAGVVTLADIPPSLRRQKVESGFSGF